MKRKQNFNTAHTRLYCASSGFGQQHTQYGMFCTHHAHSTPITHRIQNVPHVTLQHTHPHDLSFSLQASQSQGWYTGFQLGCLAALESIPSPFPIKNVCTCISNSGMCASSRPLRFNTARACARRDSDAPRPRSPRRRPGRSVSEREKHRHAEGGSPRREAACRERSQPTLRTPRAD